MDIIDEYRISSEEGTAIAENLTGLSAREIFSSYIISWKIGGYCRLDKDEPTNHVHFHNCWEGHVVLDGSGVLKDEKGVHSIHPGSVLVTAPEIQHEILVQEHQTLSLLWFMFDIQPVDKSVPVQDWESHLIARFLEGHFSVNKQAGEIFSFLSFFRGYREGVSRNRHWLIRMLREMILFFLEKLSAGDRMQPEAENKSNAVFQQIFNLINRNIEKRFSVPELARVCGMSPRSLQYLFRDNLGITLTGYIAEIKANHAARALLRGVRVQPAGESIGIPDPAQFSRFFKKHFGIPPFRYKRMSLDRLRFFSTTFEETGYRKFI